MQHRFRIAYFAHTIRSDWNNGNAHFLRGLLRALGRLGHDVDIYEPEDEWSIANLRDEPRGNSSLQQFAEVYPDLKVHSYPPQLLADHMYWRTRLQDVDFVILHEWNAPELASALLRTRPFSGFRLLFHDTHHRASSSPEQIQLLGIDQFDGVLAFGEALRTIYRETFRIPQVWTMHEAADTEVFCPLPEEPKTNDVVWIGNWGEGERAEEIDRFLLTPAQRIHQYRFHVFGVRYPEEGLAALRKAGISYGGYLPNLDAPRTYSAARVTLHIPRQQYSRVMDGIPTIRVFEALACGIPLISAPWNDSERLFRDGDLTWTRNSDEMTRALLKLFSDPSYAEEQASHGRATVLARHTCMHRAEQLNSIFEELVR